MIEKKKVALKAPSDGSYDGVVPESHKSPPGAAPVVPPVTNAPQNPEGSYDAVPEPSSYNADPVSPKAPSDPKASYYEKAPVPPSSVKTVKLSEKPDSYDDLGGPSGYTEGPATTTPTPVTSSESYDSKHPGSAPGAYPKVETTTRSSDDYGTHDSGYGSETDKQSGVGYEAHSSSIKPYDASTPSKPQAPSSSGSPGYSNLSEPYDIPFKPSPVYMHTNSPSPNLSEPKLPEADYGEADAPYPPVSFPAPRGRDSVTEQRSPYSPELDPYPAPKIPMASRGDTEDPYSAFTKPFNHIGTVPRSKFAPGTAPDALVSVSTFNSNNAISPRDPYDHFGTVAHPPSPQPSARTTDTGDFEDELDGGYETNRVVLVPDRSLHNFIFLHRPSHFQVCTHHWPH